MDGQVLGGWIVFFAGVFAVVLAMAIAAAKAVLEVVKAHNQTNTLDAAKPPTGWEIALEVMKTPAGFLFILGALAMHLGLVMINGGHFLGISAISFDDPTPAAA